MSCTYVFISNRAPDEGATEIDEDTIGSGETQLFKVIHFSTPTELVLRNDHLNKTGQNLKTN